MFKAGEEVLIVSCEDDSRAEGKTGRIVDEVTPGEFTDYRWTVNKISPLIGPVLCHGYELQKTGR